MTYEVKSGQDIFDVSIQAFGNIEDGLFDIITNNDIDINIALKSAQKLTINNEKAGVGIIKTYFKQRIFTVNNADLTSLTTKIGDFNNDYNEDY